MKQKIYLKPAILLIAITSAFLAQTSRATDPGQISPRTAEELLSKISEVFRPLQHNEACERELAQPTDTNLYCNRLHEVACTNDPNPRFDRTGGVYSSQYKRGLTGLPRQTMDPYSAQLQAFIGTRVNAMVDGQPQAFRNLFANNRLNSPKLNECVQKLFYLFLRVNRGQFQMSNSNFDYRDVDLEKLDRTQVSSFLGNECRVGNQNLLREYMTSDAVQNFRSEVDEKVTEAIEKSELMTRIRTIIFPNVKASAIRVIQQSRNIPDDQKRVMIERLNNTVLSGCTRLDRLAFGDLAYTIASKTSSPHQVAICPAALASCQSEFCLVSMLGHELSHVNDFCQFRSASYDPTRIRTQAALETEYPMGKMLQCVRSQLQTPAFAGSNVCQNVHLMEGMCDHVGHAVLADYMQQMNSRREVPLNEHDFRRGVANSNFCLGRADNTNISSYPGSRQRINLNMNSPPLRRLMNCPVRPNAQSCEI